jgi:hypothetical protein
MRDATLTCTERQCNLGFTNEVVAAAGNLSLDRYELSVASSNQISGSGWREREGVCFQNFTVTGSKQ